MADKEYYVKVDFEWGVDEGGEFTAKNRGNAVWVSMPYDHSVMLQNYAVIPCLTEMFTKAGELGAQLAEATNMPPKGNPNK